MQSPPTVYRKVFCPQSTSQLPILDPGNLFKVPPPPPPKSSKTTNSNILCTSTTELHQKRQIVRPIPAMLESSIPIGVQPAYLYVITHLNNFRPAKTTHKNISAIVENAHLRNAFVNLNVCDCKTRQFHERQQKEIELLAYTNTLLSNIQTIAIKHLNMHMHRHTCVHTYPIRDLEATLMQTTLKIEKVVENSHSRYYRVYVHTTSKQPPKENFVTSCDHISEWSLIGFNETKHAIIAEELYATRPNNYEQCNRVRQEVINRGFGKSPDLLSKWMSRKDLTHSYLNTDEDDGNSITIAASASLPPRRQWM